MDLFRIPLYIFLFLGFYACSNGDKASIIGADFGDTSFVNEKFSGNKKNYEAVQNPCEIINASQVSKRYKVAPEAVMMDNAVERGNTKSCRFLIKMSDEKFDHLTGVIAVHAEISEENDLGGIAQATGSGTDWIEAWEMKKMLSKSSEYIPDLGKAVIWFGAKRHLLIKLEGYSLSITTPGSAFNEKEKALNRDYKSIALEIAKSSGLF